MKWLVGVSLLTAVAGSYLYARQTLATSVTFASGSSIEWLPLQVSSTRQTFLTGRINGQDVSVLLDTAAGATLVDAAVAAPLGLTIGRSVSVNGITGTVPAHFATGLAIDIGTMRIHPRQVVVLDLRDLAEKLGQPVPLILGRDLFDHAVVELDYPHSRAAFHDAATSSAPVLGHVLPLRSSGGHYECEATIEGQAAAPVNVDIGASEGITVLKYYADTHHLLDHRLHVSTMYAGGVIGTSVSHQTTLSSFELSGFVFRDVPAAFDETAGGAFASHSTAANIGAGIWQRFHLTIDVPHGRLALAAGADWNRPFDRNRLGLQTRFRDSGLDVLHVAAESPAGDGWRAGDRVMALNGKEIDANYLTEWRSATGAPVGKSVTVRDGHGQTHTLILADYY